MSHILFDYLNDSPLFVDRHIDEAFASFREVDLQRELQQYREYVISKIEDIAVEVQSAVTNLTVHMQSFNSPLPKSDMLKQLSLYMDSVIVRDPIFELTTVQSPIADTMGKYLGFENTGLDRRELSAAISYVKSATPLVALDFMKFVPLHASDSQVREVLLHYSPTRFSELVPQDILRFFRRHAEVRPLVREADGWRIDDGPLRPCRGIAIGFKGHSKTFLNTYHLFESEVVSMNDATGEVVFSQYLPEEPPDIAYFQSWVVQSINRSAGGLFEELLHDLEQVGNLGGMYLATSDFVHELLGHRLGRAKGLRQDFANLVMNLELPILENVSLERILEVRSKDGEAFANFRVALERNLRDLRSMDDPVKLKTELENLTHEMSEAQVFDVESKMRSLTKKTLFNGVIGAASLATTILTHGISVLGVILAASKGYQQYSQYLDEVKQNPAYFLWKVKKRSPD